MTTRTLIVKHLDFAMNSRPTPLWETLRGEIDPVDSENDSESLDWVFHSQKTYFFNEFEANSVVGTSTGGHRISTSIVIHHASKSMLQMLWLLMPNQRFIDFGLICLNNPPSPPGLFGGAARVEKEWLFGGVR